LDLLRGQLMIGNSANGRHSWWGRLFGLAVFHQSLDSSTVADHASKWKHNEAASLENAPGIAGLYLFDERSGHQAMDLSSYAHHLVIPERYEVLQKSILRLSENQILNLETMVDTVVNLLGFIPFGVFAFHYFRSTTRTTLAGLFLSLMIELGQVWLPTRTSSAADLILNTAGTLMGALVAMRSGTGKNKFPLLGR
jgi:VanZ family protein